MKRRYRRIDDTHNREARRHSSNLAPDVARPSENPIADHRTNHKLRAIDRKEPQPESEQSQREANDGNTCKDSSDRHSKENQHTQPNRCPDAFSGGYTLRGKFREEQKQHESKQYEGRRP